MADMKTPIQSTAIGPETPPDIQFSSICDGERGLIYRLKAPHSDRIAVTIKFGHVIAYRVADEGVLLDYWARKIANTSHLVWELRATEFLEWMERVSMRAHVIEDGVRHFIVVTATTCLEVLTTIEPTIEVHEE